VLLRLRALLTRRTKAAAVEIRQLAPCSSSGSSSSSSGSNNLGSVLVPNRLSRGKVEITAATAAKEEEQTIEEAGS